MAKIQIITRGESFKFGVDESCWFVLRRLDPDEFAKSRERNTKLIPALGDEPERREVNEIEVDRDLLDWIVLDWIGVEGPDGTPAECTRENKYRLPAGIKSQIFLATRAVNLQGDLELELKNLSAPSGTPVR